MDARRRLRDLGIILGRFPTGRWNAITDVAGVRVGHTTLVSGSGALDVGTGPVRTGVTAILPMDGNIFDERLIGGAFILHGAGEMSGLIQLLEWGLVETPILLTNTLSVGNVSRAAVQYMLEHNPGIGDGDDVIIPLVGECDDSFLNDIAGAHVSVDHVFQAIDSADSGPVAEGSVGAGTGMVTCDLKAGIGTASRILPEEAGGYTLGVLVLTNFGRLEDLRVDGMPVGRALVPRFESLLKRRSLYGSIITVLATDAPLTTHQVNRLCKRAALGIGRTGSYAAHGSGEIIVGFSTANRLARGSDARLHTISMLADRCLDPMYRAAIECTEEAILNALCMAEDMEGVNGNFAPALPLDQLVKFHSRFLVSID